MALVTLSLGRSPNRQLFPRTAQVAKSSTAPTEEGKWRLSGVIAHAPLAEGQLPMPASMLTCPTSETCFAVSNPDVVSFKSAPDYLMDLGSGVLDASSDGGNSWSELALPTGTVLTTPLVCVGAEDCTAGAIALADPQSIASVAPSDASTVVGAIETTNQDSPNLNGCDTDTLKESQMLSVIADYCAIATQSATNPCAAYLEEGVDRSRLPDLGDGIPADVDSLYAGGAALAQREQLFSSMSVYGVSNATAVMAVTTNGGKSWTEEPLPQGTGPLVSLTCSTPSACMALEWPWSALGSGSRQPGSEPLVNGSAAASTLLSTTNDGASWSTQSFPVLEQDLVSLSCSSASACLATGSTGPAPGAGAGLILSTDNGGVSWQPAQLPEVGLVSQATCPSAEDCFAIAAQGQVLSSSDGGLTWASVSPSAGTSGLSPAQTLTSISCSSVTSCSVTGGLPHGGFGNGESSNGASGGYVDEPGSTSSSFSAASGPGSGPAVILSTNNGGSSWNEETFGWEAANGDLLLRADWIQCFAPNSCIAIGGSSSFATPVIVGSTS